jgi:hypothetical protein
MKRQLTHLTIFGFISYSKIDCFGDFQNFLNDSWRLLWLLVKLLYEVLLFVII